MERLEDWGNNQQLAQMINSIDAENYIADLRARVKNLTLTAVHHKDLRKSTTTAILAGVLPITILALLGAGAATLWKICGSSMSTKARQWTERRRKNRGPYNLYIKRKQWRDPPPTPEIMEEACSHDSFDLPPPEVSRIAVPEQAETVATPTTAVKLEAPASTVVLPSHPVLPLDEKELQEHRNAILQQQMLGRQLLSELTRRHNSRQNLQEE